MESLAERQRRSPHGQQHSWVLNQQPLDYKPND
jgi:hypothetical protein